MTTPKFEAGQELTEQSFVVDREKLRAYAAASGDHNPIHLDERFAQSVGLPNVIAHGMFTMALAGEAVRRWMGPGSQVFDFSTRFTKPVVVPAERETLLHFTGKIVEVRSNEVAVEVTALCEGVKVLGQTKAQIRW